MGAVTCTHNAEQFLVIGRRIEVEIRKVMQNVRHELPLIRSKANR